MPKVNPKHNAEHLKRKKVTISPQILKDSSENHSFITQPFQNRSEKLKAINAKIFASWDLKDVEAMSTDTIIEKLQHFGVPFSRDVFLTETTQYFRAQDLAESWYKQYQLNDLGQDEDFIWMAVVVLWKRLAPDQMSDEIFEDMTYKSYSMLEKEEQYELICPLWLKMWHWLIQRTPESILSLEQANKTLSIDLKFTAWVKDIFEGLGELIDSGDWAEKILNFTIELENHFPETKKEILDENSILKGQALYFLDRRDEADLIFEQLISQNLTSRNMYERWAEIFYLDTRSQVIDINYELAKKAYNLGIQNRALKETEADTLFKYLERDYQAGKET
jgi:hypothetical protein